MSEALTKIKQYRLQILKELYHQCTPSQQRLFDRMYGDSIDKMPDSKINWAIQQCENTVKKNIKHTTVKD